MTNAAALFQGNPNHLAVSVASGDALDVRSFEIDQRMNALFSVSLEVVTDNPSLDFDAIVGKDARFSMLTTLKHAEPVRAWTGIVNHLQQVRVETTGLSTYRMTIVPPLWLLGQRRNYRIFQQITEPDIVLGLLGEWGIEPTVHLTAQYKKRKYRVQYAESDYAFMCRMLEDVGISFYFEQADEATKLVLSDAPQANEARAAIGFNDEPEPSAGEYVTKVTIGKKIRPGKYTVRDHDYRRPAAFPLMASAESSDVAVEAKLERFHYAPGAFLFASEWGEDTPFADDHGRVRADEGAAAQVVSKRLDAKRSTSKVATFETNCYDLAPGVVTSMLDHPHADLAAGKRLLVVSASARGTSNGEWRARCETRSADLPFRPAVSTKKPKIPGVESATVVGPAGEEIHTDEFGRVRVQFHWDRYGQQDENSSCWIHVSQPWGGTGFGGVNLPRIGQEVLVDFLGGDPDRPIITGRVYTNLTKVPYTLPTNKTQSGWKSNTSPTNGGYNEIMFEDKQGEELVRMQAQKDLHKLVKNDENVQIGNDRAKQVGRDDTHAVGRDQKMSVGNDRSRSVGHNEDISVANDRSKRVGGNEREVTSQNRSMVVGSNRATQIGAIDSTMVGTSHSVTISPPGEAAPAAAATSFFMTDDKIVHNTKSAAYIEMVGSAITIHAATITLNASTKITIQCDAEVDVVGVPINLNNS